MKKPDMPPSLRDATPDSYESPSQSCRDAPNTAEPKVTVKGIKSFRPVS